MKVLLWTASKLESNTEKFSEIAWRSGSVFGSGPRGLEFESCSVTDLVPTGKALNTTFLAVLR